MQTTFALLMKDQSDFALALRRFLGRAYALKAIADANAFVAAVAALRGAPDESA